MLKLRKILIITLITIAALVALGFWLPSFNKWTVDDIPLLLRIFGADRHDNDYYFAENKLAELIESDEGIQKVVSQLGSDNRLTDRGAWTILFEIGIQKIMLSDNRDIFLDHIAAQMTNDDEWTRMWAKFLMRRIFDAGIAGNEPIDYEKYLPCFVNNLKDGSGLDRRIAVSWFHGLSQFADTTKPLVKAIYDEGDFDTKIYAACALSIIDPSDLEPLPVLLDGLNSDDEQITKCIVDCIGNYGPAASDALPALVRVMNERDFYEMKSASDAIVDIGVGDGSVITLLIDVIDNPVHETRRELFRLFQQLGADAELALPLLKIQLESGVETIPNNRGALRQAIRSIEYRIERRPNPVETIPEGDSNE